MVEGPRVMNGLSTMHHYYERTFAAKKIYEKLEECVYGEGLGFAQLRFVGTRLRMGCLPHRYHVLGRDKTLRSTT